MDFCKDIHGGIARKHHVSRNGNNRDDFRIRERQGFWHFVKLDCWDNTLYSVVRGVKQAIGAL